MAFDHCEAEEIEGSHKQEKGTWFITWPWTL